jgi:hypothetical protein
VRKRSRKKDGGNSGEEDKMIDTYAWVPLISVVIGSIIAYYGVSINEEKKRRFELKKEVYTDFLDQIEEGAMVFMAEEALKRPKTEEERKEDVNHEEKLRKLLVSRIIWMHNFNKILIMIDLCGSEKIINLAHQDIRMLENFDRYIQLETDLIAAIREDLLGKRRWQFWK